MVRGFVVCAFVFLFLVILFVVSIWWQLESVQEFRRLATSRPRYCAVFVDRNGGFLDALYTLPEQSEYVKLDSVGQFAEDLAFFEDQYFWYHPGFWPPAILRAVFSGGDVGGSTLTQQVYRILTKHKERTIYRKLVEIVASVKLSFALSKREQLEVYINNAYFGAGSKLGLAAAARSFFSKKPSELSRPEGVMLISFLNLPPGDLTKTIKRVYHRYDLRIARLIGKEKIDRNDPAYAQLVNGPVFDRPSGEATAYGKFLDRAVGEAQAILAGTGWTLEKDGLTVETTLDRQVNDTSCAILETAVPSREGVEPSFVMLTQENEVVCYISNGRSLRGDLDRLTSNNTMSASRFKVLAYAVAIEKMMSRGMSSSEVLNRPLPTTYQLTSNHIIRDHVNMPTIPLRGAISESKNAPACFAANEIATPQEIVNFCRFFSDATLHPYPSIALGTQGFSELDLCYAYSTILVRRGQLRAPCFVKRIIDPNGRVIYDNSRSIERRKERTVVLPQVGQCLRQALREGAMGGTSRALNDMPELVLKDVATKTGTSERNLHIGVTGVVGQRTFSFLIQGKGLGGSAGQVAVPIAGRILAILERMGRL